MQTRFKKVIGDLKTDVTRNLMLILAISIGVFGIGAILGAYTVVNREMATNYESTAPASATIEVEDNISAELVDSVRKFPGIEDATRRATVSGRMMVNGKWYPVLLFVIDDFDNLRISTFRHVSGATHPADGSMLVERTALTMMDATVGGKVMIKTPHGTEKLLNISGIVHDPGLAPAWQEQAGYAYITLATLHQLGETQGFDLLRITVRKNENSSEDITRKAEALSDWLTKSNYHVHEIQVPPPGKHPHQSQMNAVLSIFTVFSFMILGLASILVATSMATLMVKQVRQIGVMKTMGGTSVQIASLYFLMVFILCAIALIVSVPLSRVAAFGFYTQLAALLNLDITDTSIPYLVLLIQIGSGIIIPFIAVAFPVIRGSRISVRKALDNYGVDTKNQRGSLWTVKLFQFDFISDIFRLSLRNAFRQRARLILTLGLLAAGGAMFMTALNVSDAWDKNLKRIYVQRLYDQEVRLNESIHADSLIDAIKEIDGVKTVEGWNYSSTSLVKSSAYEITRTYPDKGHGSFVMQAVPIPTNILNPTITEGRWLHTEGTDDVVLNQLARTPDMKIGDMISLALNGEETRWKIAGFTEDVGAPASAYVSLATFSKLAGTSGKIKMLRIAYHDRSQQSAITRNKKVDELLERDKAGVSSTMPVWMLHNAVAAHMRVLVNSLLAMAILMAIVGTLGLMSTVSMNVLERTREIGVMRAIGATPAKIRNLIVWEGLTIGTLSILIAFIVSLGLSYFMGEFIGHISFRTPLSLTVSLLALVIWTGIIIIGSYVATFFPARRANKVTTREALAYE